MPQIIYTNTLMGDDGLPLNTTPAAKYVGLDLASIFDLIIRGELQCGNGEDYPVEWDENSAANAPWAQGGPQSSGPWYQY